MKRTIAIDPPPEIIRACACCLAPIAPHLTYCRKPAPCKKVVRTWRLEVSR